MPAAMTLAPIGAVRVDHCADAEPLFATLAGDLHRAGYRLAGVLQINSQREDRRRCDMKLRDLHSGAVTCISEDRGNEARGCRLDYAALAEVCESIKAAVRAGVDLVIINKFGKAESEGGGMREVIAEAIAHDIPVLVCANPEHHANLLAFAGELAFALPLCEIEIGAWLRGIRRRGLAVAA